MKSCLSPLSLWAISNCLCNSEIIRSQLWNPSLSDHWMKEIHLWARTQRTERWRWRTITYNLAVSHSNNLDEYTTAIPLLRHSIKLNPQFASAWSGLSCALHSQCSPTPPDLQESLKAAEESHRLLPGHLQALCNMEIARQKMGN